MTERDGDNFTLIIEPNSIEKQYWKDLWNYKELFYFLAWRDILVRYKQTLIGLAWSVIRPLLTMVVFTIVFGKLAQLPSNGAPYPIMVFSALLPWQFFSSAFAESSNSLIGNSGLISKIYFPRIIIPVSSVVVSFIDFLVSFVILLGLMIFYKFMPTISMLLIIPFSLMAIMISIGASLWLSAINVKYRDVKYIVPFIVQFGLYISPVGFSSSVIPEKWRLLYSLNPMVGVIDGFRCAILGEYSSPIYYIGLLLSVLLSFIIFFFGIRYFRKMEKSFADVI